MAPTKHTTKKQSKPLPDPDPSPSPSPSPSPPLSPHGDNDEDEEYTASSDAPSPPSNTLPKTTTNSNVDKEDGDDDEDDVDDGGEGDSTDDGETPSKFTIKPSVPTPAEGGGDTEPRSPPPPPSKSKLVKPLNTKSMDSKSKADSKKVAAATPAKRPAEASGAARSDDEGQHPAKKQIIQRLWSDEDEITILKGMVEYKRKGRDPLADLQGFFRYIRKSLQLECTHTQLSSKLRVFRSKFYSWVKRANEGKQPTSNKPKDKLVFELSQKIWGSKLDEKEKNNVEEEVGNKELDAKVKSGSEMSNGKAKKKANKSGQRTSAVSVALPAIETTAAPVAAAPVLVGGEERCWLMDDLCIRGVGVSEELVKKGVSLMDRRVVAEYDEKWKAMKMMEMEVHMKRAELVKAHIGAILEALQAGRRFL